MCNLFCFVLNQSHFFTCLQSLQDRPTVSAYTTSTAAAATESATSTNSIPSNPLVRTATTAVTATATLASSNAGVASVRPVVPSNIVNTNADAPARIAPGMPWEHAGAIARPSSGGTALSSFNVTSRSSDASPLAVAIPSAPSSSDRRQRLRCDNYDSAHDRSPVETLTSNLSSASWDPSAVAEAMMAMPAEEEDMVPVSHSMGNSNSRKRRAERASSEENSKPSAEEQDNWLGDSTGTSSTPPPTEEELAQQRAARVAATDARLRHLAQELCPLIDRFGRVLTDVAPHLWELGEMDVTAAAAAQSNATNAGANRATPETAHANAANAFEASLLALLRERYPFHIIIHFSQFFSILVLLKRTPDHLLRRLAVPIAPPSPCRHASGVLRMTAASVAVPLDWVGAWCPTTLWRRCSGI